MIRTHAAIDGVEGMIANMCELGDCVALLWKDLSKQDIQLKKHDEEVPLLKLGYRGNVIGSLRYRGPL